MSITQYAAACVRACALRNVLLSPGEWCRLADVESAAAALDMLNRRGLFPSPVADVRAAERAAHETVIRNSVALLRFARNEWAELLRCFVQYYDVLNVGGAVRRIHGMSVGEGPPGAAFFDTGRSGLFRVTNLEAATNYPALAAVLKHSPLGGAFNDALRRYRDDENAALLVERLEARFFTGWVRAAKRCGMFEKTAGGHSGLGAFLVCRAIEAVARLKYHRAAETDRLADWLAPVAPPGGVDRCLAVLNEQSDAELVAGLIRVLLPRATMEHLDAVAGSARGPWGGLNAVTLYHALRAGRGVAFSPDFLTGVLVLHFCQVRELTVLLESKAAGVDVGPTIYAEYAR